MAQLIPQYVQNFIPFVALTKRDLMIAEKFLHTPYKRIAVFKAILTDATKFIEWAKKSKNALYMAEGQSQGMYDFWHFSAIYHALFSKAECAGCDLMQLFVTIETNRPHYLVENWRSVLIQASSQVKMQGEQLADGTTVDFRWHATGSGNQTLDGSLYSERGVLLSSGSWEIVDDDRNLSVIQNEMLVELQAMAQS